jgi:WD40 repeat protein/transcriptional regulator with XRE-family HTH domain
MSQPPTFGELLRHYRLAANLSQQALAERAGLSVDAIAALERGRRTMPRFDTVALIADGLQLAPSERALLVAAAHRRAAQAASPPAQHDWGDAPAVGAFYGRQAEQRQLGRWLADEHAPLIAVLGMGGMGKTTLAAQVARQHAGQFEVVIWRSLINAPALPDVLGGWLRALAGQKLAHMPNGLDAQFELLFGALRERRCLLVLDNLESLMSGGERAGHYRPGYEGYGQLLQRMGQGAHQSCLLLTSREAPRELARLLADSTQVRVMALAGLGLAGGGEFLAARGLSGSPASAVQLVERYSGNPLALRLVADTIEDVFAGDIDAFLGGTSLVFDDIRDVLDQQFARLAPLERDILLWLAIEREPMDEAQLWAAFSRVSERRSFVEALRSLLRRSLLEHYGATFGLQNVVSEYLADQLVGQAAGEIGTEAPALLHSHALIGAGAREYVRLSQQRVLLQPIGERLVGRYGAAGAVARCIHMLETARCSPPRLGFLAGNLLNLLLHLGADLRGLDLSGMCVWQAYLRGADLPGVNFSGADLQGSVFTDYVGAVTAVALSPDGQLLAAGVDSGAIYLWRLADQQLVGICQGHGGHIGGLAWSPDGRLLASASDDTTVRLWEVGSWRTLRTLVGHSGGLTSVAFHPGGALLASASMDHTALVWDAMSGQLLHTLADHTGPVASVAWSPDGRLLATASHDCSVRLWDWRSGQATHTLQGHAAAVATVAFRPAGAGAGRAILASGSHDQMLRIWDAQRGALLGSLAGHGAPVISAAFSADGRLLFSGSDDQTIRVWDMRDPAGGRAIRSLDGHYGAVSALAAQARPGGPALLVSGSQDKTVRLWDFESGSPLAVLRGNSKWVQALAFRPDGALLAGGSDGQCVRVWDGRTGRTLHVLRGHTSLTEKLAFADGGGQLVSAGWDGTARIWDVQRGAASYVLRGHAGPLAVAAIGPGPPGRRLVATGGLDHSVRPWDALTGAPRACWQTHSGRVVALAFRPDGGLLASASWDTTIALWDVGRGELACLLRGHAAPIECLAFSPDGRLLASGSWDGDVRVWDVAAGCEGTTDPCILPGHTHGLEMVAFSPDGRALASCGCDYLVCVWDVASGRLRLRLEAHTSWVRGLAWSDDGALLASGGDDGTVRVWDVTPEGAGACLEARPMEDPYTGMCIAGASGLTEVQKMALRALGAVDQGLEGWDRGKR